MSELVVGTTKVSSNDFASRGVLRPALAALSVGAAYFIGAKIGFALTFQPHPVSTLWPPNSILFAALILSSPRSWWFLLLAAFPAHILVQLNADIPSTMILCWFVSNCTEALISASLLRYLTNKSELRFDNTHHVSVFILVSLLGPFLSSFLDAAFVMLNHFGDTPYWVVFRLRFFSNVLASLTLVPLIVIWGRGGFPSFRHTFWKGLEIGALGIGLLIVGLISFRVRSVGQQTRPALLYLPLPLLLWAAIRFGPRGTSAALVIVSVFEIWGAIHGFGPFATQSAEMNALSVQMFLILASLPLLFLAALIKQRERAQ
jgi:two-component system sensor kinase FixL